jgi:hypothetical protein
VGAFRVAVTLLRRRSRRVAIQQRPRRVDVSRACCSRSRSCWLEIASRASDVDEEPALPSKVAPAVVAMLPDPAAITTTPATAIAAGRP